jgi:hypothetical protein
MFMTEKGFSLGDIYKQIEILKAFSDAGYINIANKGITASRDVDMQINGHEVITNLEVFREKDISFNKLADFINLITDASALSVIKPKIDKMLEKKRPAVNTQPLPAYSETVYKYLTGSDSDNDMAGVVKAVKYAASIQSPHFVYFSNIKAHYINFGNEAGGVAYEEPIGRAFLFDENGNYYKERLDDPLDVRLYLPQYKYTVKQMIAQVDTIIEDDPGAVIILQADHGIHGHGVPGGSDTHFESLSVRGYSLEDQLNLNLHVMSAVRIPPQYVRLSQPLDPLDIARYLVNNFVGKGNYGYLFYKEEDSE